MGAIGLALFLACPSCAHPRATSVPDLDPKEVNAALEPRPLPANPTYVRTLQPCVLFVRVPSSGDLVPIGMLQKDTYVILLRQRGEWANIQLKGGQHGMVMSANLEPVPTDTVRAALPEPAEPPPSSGPPPAPDGDESRIQTTLLDGYVG